MDLSELLTRQDVAAFNAQRGVASRPDLFAADLSGLELPGVDLSAANLDKADLTGTNLTGGRLARAFASEVDATDVKLVGVLGLMLKMKDAVMEGADLTDADLSRSDLSGSDLTRSVALRTRFISARLKGVKAPDSRWNASDLSEALLSDANLRGASLATSVLKEAVLANADLTGADLSGCDATKCKAGRVRLSRANLTKTRWIEADLTDADLTGADLSGADLSRARLNGADLTGARLVGAVLVDAVLDGARLHGVDLEGADLTGVDTQSLGLTEAQLGSVKGSGARVDANAAVVFDEASVAVRPGAIAVLWMNPDTVEFASLRWRLRVEKPGGKSFTEVEGVLPVSAASVLEHEVLPFQDGFALVAIVDRSGGAAVFRWMLGLDGSVSSPVSGSLGYEPLVLPTWAADASGLWMWGLGRRGPTVVLHRDAGDGFTHVSSEVRPQATGFCGRTPPVLACKARVLMEVRRGELGAPARAPEGFPTPTSVAVPVDGQLLAVWNTPRALRDPGGLRYQWLGARIAREVEVLTKQPSVSALAGWGDGARAVIAWIERTLEGDVLGLAELPAVKLDRFSLPDEVEQLRIVPPWGEEPQPVVALGLSGGGLIVISLEGRELAFFQPRDRRED